MFSQEFMILDEDWQHRIQSFQEQLKELTHRSAPGEATYIGEVLEELSIAVEELKVQNEELQRLQQDLWLERHRYQDFFNFAPDAYLVTNAAGIILEANQTASRLLCLPQQFIIGKPIVTFAAPEDLGRLYERINQAKGHQSTNFEFTLHSRRAGELPVEVRIAAACDLQGNLLHLRWLIRDISARKQAEEQLRQQALYDALTGLPNRSLFTRQLELALQNRQQHGSTRQAVLFLDLDGFKHVNDSLGHLAGDQLLMIVAQRLLACVRPNDTVARFGGDEFAILLEAVHDEAGAVLIAERIHETLSNPLEIDGQRLFISASIGIALNQDNEDPLETAESILGNADMAMYEAKEGGPCQTQVFTRGLRSQSERMVLMKTEFRDALDRREFLLYYQPIVDIATGCLRGVEALVRWQHPRLGLISYDQFLMVAQRTQALSILEHWIFVEACTQGKAWLDRYGLGDDFVLHINLSAHRLADENLVSDISQALASTHFPPSQLTLELTENSLIRHPQQMAQVLKQLQDLGITISLDDFGSGYSSLSHLSTFPIDEIKIDPLFIRNLHQQERLADIVNNTVNLGHDLNLRVIAEGIETESQLHFLIGTGCRLGQGFLFARPLAADPIANLLASQKSNLLQCYQFPHQTPEMIFPC